MSGPTPWELETLRHRLKRLDGQVSENNAVTYLLAAYLEHLPELGVVPDKDKLTEIAFLLEQHRERHSGVLESVNEAATAVALEVQKQQDEEDREDQRENQDRNPNLLN